VYDETVRYDWLSPYPQGSTAGTHPLQVALAVSLVTGAERGRAARGRFYLPVPVSPLEGPYNQLTEAYQASYLAGSLELLDIIEEHVAGWQVGIVSNIGAGAERAVTGVRVGQALDTIRSRRENVPEDYLYGPRV
jgi:hypothetical protein